MAYNQHYSGGRNNAYSGQRGGYGQRNSSARKEGPSIHPIEEPLSKYYADTAQLYLPKGKADRKADDFKQIPPHQLRKILTSAKLAVAEVESGKSNFETARNILFSLLPLSAYNAGRDAKLKPLYYFLAENISEKTIQSEKDIDVFDALITSIVAYHKFNANK